MSNPGKIHESRFLSFSFLPTIPNYFSIFHCVPRWPIETTRLIVQATSFHEVRSFHSNCRKHIFHFKVSVMRVLVYSFVDFVLHGKYCYLRGCFLHLRSVEIARAFFENVVERAAYSMFFLCLKTPVNRTWL